MTAATAPPATKTTTSATSQMRLRLPRRSEAVPDVVLGTAGGKTDSFAFAVEDDRLGTGASARRSDS